MGHNCRTEWRDITLNIGGANGNASTVTIEDDAMPGKNEVLVQYGNQDTENPDQVNYDARVNYIKDEFDKCGSDCETRRKPRNHWSEKRSTC